VFNDELLTSFIDNFYGYGNYQAPYWFIGMEEGGGETFEEINMRLQAWQQRGRQELEDLAEYHKAIGITKFFIDPAKLQRTWNKLIRILLAAEGRDTSILNVRDYQSNYLGRTGGSSCLTELLPLPSPGTNKWLHYAEHSKHSFLATRIKYECHVKPLRILQLRNMIAKYKPNTVVFYGTTKLNDWNNIADIHLNILKSHEVYYGSAKGTTYLVVKHPVSYGATNMYFQNIGALIRSGLPEV